MTTHDIIRSDMVSHGMIQPRIICKKEFNNMIPHELHHIDHNRTNNTLNNFIVLCSNCHGAVHRYGVKLPI